MDWYGQRCPAVSKTKLCIHHEDQPPASACFGDSGGPLILDQNGFAMVIGITSYLQTPKCSPGDFRCILDNKCRTDSIDIYTKVKAYLPWIKEITGQGK